ncbi:response regulator [Candidatus Saccharibacteria bacterium]|nr:response regulator [Candidatus Saccharibacteria bacterium]
MKQQRVLLVEDDTALNDAFCILLQKNGYEVKTTFNGQEALEALGDFTPNIILLDLLMPVMDGKEFLRRYTNSDNIPIIIFSNLDTKSEVQEAIDLGATRYMLKAWATPHELLRVIQDTVKK